MTDIDNEAGTLPAPFSFSLSVGDDARRILRTGQLELAHTFVVDSNETAQAASSQLNILRADAKRIEDAQAQFLAPARAVMAQAVSLAQGIFGRSLDDNELAQEYLRELLTDFTLAERRKAEAARRQAEEAAAAARRRAAEEAAAVQARAREQAEEARRRAAEQEARRLKAEGEGDRRAAEQAAAQAAAAIVRAEGIEDAAAEKATQIAIAAEASVPIPSTKPDKITGFHTRTVLIGIVRDETTAKRFIGSHDQFHNLIDINQSKLNQTARALGKQLIIDGIEIVEQTSGVSTAR